jgi:thiamine-phosphate pyrophosphorylase
MDQRLIAWARSVKARRRRTTQRDIPVLWLLTDARRVPDPLPSAARLPKGLGGVLLRHDGEPSRAELGRALAALCRQRRLALVVAGDVRLAHALRAGVHLRGGYWRSPLRPKRGPVTSSAHNRGELLRARRAGATLVFLSPAFATTSHPSARALGPLRWARLCQTGGREGGGLPTLALGGVHGSTVRRLGTRCAGAGAIGALAYSPGDYGARSTTRTST